MSTDTPIDNKLKNILEAALLAAGRPLTLDNLQELFLEDERPDKKVMRTALAELQDDYFGRGVEVIEVGGGFRINVNEIYSPWISRLWDERPARYSKALLETLSLIAYRQPITRSEIEDIRGVSVSTNIIKTLLEREWVRVVGQRDVPGRPSLYATTREFLNYFSMKSLADLPTLAEIRDLDSINRELEFDDPNMPKKQVDGEGAEPEQVEGVNDSDAAVNETEPETVATPSNLPGQTPGTEQSLIVESDEIEIKNEAPYDSGDNKEHVIAANSEDSDMAPIKATPDPEFSVEPDSSSSSDSANSEATNVLSDPEQNMSKIDE